MKLSIIIPIYNAQKYLRKCLETVAECPSSEIECILVNDGSKDSSLEICQEFSQKDSRFLVIDKKNEGVSVARNTGVLHASGKYILFLDADDYIDVRKWNQILMAIEEAKYDFIAYSYYTLYENGAIEEELFSGVGKEATDIQTARKILLATASFNACWGKLLRCDIIKENSLEFQKGVKTGEDTVFIMDYFQHVQTYSIRNESIIYYRQHDGSAMHRINMEDKLKDFQAIYDYRRKLAQLWKDTDLEKEMYRQFFSIITDLFLKFSEGNSFIKSRKAYQEAGKGIMVQQIIQGIPYERLTPRYKKLEYLFITKRLVSLLTIYFKFKAMFR